MAFLLIQNCTLKCLYQTQLYQNTPKAPEKPPKMKRYCCHRISRIFLDKIHFILSELTQYYSRHQPKCNIYIYIYIYIYIFVLIFKKFFLVYFFYVQKLVTVLTVRDNDQIYEVLG